MNRDQLIETYGLHVLVLPALVSLFLLPGQNTFASEEPLSFEQLIEELEHPDSERCWEAILGAKDIGSSSPKKMIELQDKHDLISS